jgi:hypothetical protein
MTTINIKPTKIIKYAIAIIAIIVVLSMGNKLIENNKEGYHQVKQSVLGKMSVRLKPGPYWQLFGNIDTYSKYATVGYGIQKGDGVADVKAFEVTFSDGSKAHISGLVRVEIPSFESGMLTLKEKYPLGYDHFLEKGVLPIVENAVKLSANIRTAAEAYTTIALFQQAVEDQLKYGAYLTKSEIKTVKKATGDVETRPVTVIVYDKNGEPKRMGNKLKELGCRVDICTLNHIKFDKNVEESISKRKQAVMLTELKKQEALTAIQKALTAAEEGKAKVATAKYEEEVINIKAVTEAKKKFEVAQYEAKTAKEIAKRIEAEGRAKATANKLLKAAGLTPLQAVEWDYKTKVGVAAELAKVKFPDGWIIAGGGSGGKTITPFDAIGYNSFYDLSQKMASTKTKIK